MLNKIIAKIHAYALNKEGATAIEYGLIAGGIALAIVAVVFLLGDDLEAMFTNIRTELATAGS